MSRVRNYEVLHQSAGWAHVLLGKVASPAVIHVSTGVSVPWPNGGTTRRVFWIGRAIVEAIAAELPGRAAYPRVLQIAAGIARRVVQAVTRGDLTSERRPLAVGEPVPASATSAADRFTCGILKATLDGAACAKRWQTRNRSGADACIDPCQRCPAGKARVELLQVAEPRRRLASPAALTAPDAVTFHSRAIHKADNK